MEPEIFAFALPLISLLFLLLSHRANSRKDLIVNLPTSKTQGVFIGLVELKGTAECEHPVRSYLAEIDCVYYHYSVSEQWEREVVETYTDSEGKSRTRTRTESGWTTLDSNTVGVPFYLQDDTGVVLVRPEGAEIRPRSLFHEVCHQYDPLYYEKGPRRSIMDSTGRRRFTESGIPLHQRIFVVGKARERNDVVAAEVADDDNAKLYLLTVESEEEVVSRLGWTTNGWNFLGLALAAGGGAAAAQAGGAFLFGGVYLLVWFITSMISLFNQLIDVRNRLRQGWSTLEVQLKRRFDLIPRLVSVVDAFQSQEGEVLAMVAALRAEMDQYNATDSGQHGMAPRLNLIVEKYPELLAQKSFQQLQEQLVETEQRIALARSYFNDIATAYNTRLQIVPDGWMAKLMGFRTQFLFEVMDFERARVEIELDS